LRARHSRVWDPFKARTPTTRVPDRRREPARVRVATVRLGRLRKGWTNALYALYALLRRPCLIVDGVNPMRSLSCALVSATRSQPIPFADARIA
jgi:hypothetical protein